MLNVNRVNEKTFQKQQVYMVALTNQYRIICDKLGIAPSLNFTRAEELTNIMTKKAKEDAKKQAESALIKRLITEDKSLSKTKGPRSKSVRDNRGMPKIEVKSFIGKGKVLLYI